MPSTGIDDALRLEAIYFSSPVPRNSAILTVLGAVFDRVYFPGVYLPKGGFDIAELDKEIARLEPLASVLDEAAVLVRALKFTKYAKTLEGFCDFGTYPPPDSIPVSSDLANAFSEIYYGPPSLGGCHPHLIQTDTKRTFLAVTKVSYFQGATIISLAQ